MAALLAEHLPTEAPTPVSIDTGTQAVSEELGDEGDEDDYLKILKSICADNLNGQRCKSKRCPMWKTCPPLSNGKHCEHATSHDGPFHILTTCKHIRQIGRRCENEGCQFGHDYPEIRKAISDDRRMEGLRQVAMKRAAHLRALNYDNSMAGYHAHRTGQRAEKRERESLKNKRLANMHKKI